MTTSLADIHRSKLETVLATEIEFRQKIIQLSDDRISMIKRLIVGVDLMYTDISTEVSDAALSLPQTAAPTTSSKAKKKKKSKKPQAAAKPVKAMTGKVPRLIDAIQIVMRNKNMRAPQIYDLLKAKHWLPRSQDPLSYIRFTLSSEGEIFRRVEGERGVYHLDEENPYYSGKVPASKDSHPPKAKSKPAVEPQKSSSPASESIESSEPPPPAVEAANESQPAPNGMSHEESLNLVDKLIDGDLG